MTVTAGFTRRTEYVVDYAWVLHHETCRYAHDYSTRQRMTAEPARLYAAQHPHHACRVCVPELVP